MRTIRAGACGLLLIGSLLLTAAPVSAVTLTFAPGDVFLSFKTGEVNWYHSDGMFVQTLIGSNTGHAEGMGFDASGNLYVTHWCVDSLCALGNNVDKFTSAGVLVAGGFGSGYNCNPTSIVFDSSGNGLVGQADCTQDIFKFNSLGVFQANYDAAVEGRGTNWIDLDSTDCQIFYTSVGPHVKRFNVCSNTQGTDLNALPLPGGNGEALQILPSGGLLVANDDVIVRLDASGNVVQTYDVTGQPSTFYGLDLAGDGASFWVTNINSGLAFRIAISDGSVMTTIDTHRPGDLKGVAVARGPSSVTRRGRMTGGGSIFTGPGETPPEGTRVTHGFELHCDVSQKPNNFEVNTHPSGGGGDRFHLEQMTSVTCYDDPSINPTPPAAPFDTLVGTGTGTWDGQSGYTAQWKLTDAGEPGTSDTWSMTITDPNNNVVLNFKDRPLTNGNHQAHK